jgi:hypothetical protein
MVTINAPHYPGEIAKRVLETFDIKEWSLF